MLLQMSHGKCYVLALQLHANKPSSCLLPGHNGKHSQMRIYTTIFRDDRRQIPSKRHVSGLLKSGRDLADCPRANYESSGPLTLESLQLEYASFSDDRTYKKVASKFKVKGWHTTGNSLILATSYVYTQVTAKIISRARQCQIKILCPSRCHLMYSV